MTEGACPGDGCGEAVGRQGVPGSGSPEGKGLEAGGRFSPPTSQGTG